MNTPPAGYESTTPSISRRATEIAKIPTLFWVVIALSMVFAGTSTNPLESCAVVAALATGVLLIWGVDPSRAMLFVFTYQWAQASVKVFQANVQGVPLDQFAEIGGQVDTATWLSLVAVVVVAAGMRLAARVGPAKRADVTVLPDYVIGANPMFWFRVYMVFLLTSLIASAFAGLVSELFQPLQALAGLKWGFFWLFAYFTFSRPDRRVDLFAIVFAIEFVLGLGGFFSDFKSVFFVTFMAMLAAQVRVTLPRLLIIVPPLIALVFVSLVWTAIKTEYRDFVGGGSNMQLVTVGYEERMTYLGELISNVTSQDMIDAVDVAATRFSYVEIFGSVLDSVPALVPHEGGAIWLDAVIRPFTPRLLFPDKSVIEDSARTNTFTGLDVFGQERGTSISIGYVGESYIDFGFFGMFLPLFMWGMLLGLVSRYFINHSRIKGALGGAMVVAVLLPQAALETSITKAFGGLIVSVLVAFLVAKYAVPKTLMQLARLHAR